MQTCHLMLQQDSPAKAGGNLLATSLLKKGRFKPSVTMPLAAVTPNSLICILSLISCMDPSESSNQLLQVPYYVH